MNRISITIASFVIYIIVVFSAIIFPAQGEEFSEIVTFDRKTTDSATPVPTEQFSVNAYRVDPYKNFKFRVKWDGRYVAGVSKITPLTRTTEVIEENDENDPNHIRKSPGITSYKPITLERGVTHDIEFEKWANEVWQVSSGESTEEFRKDIIIELYNEAGQLVMAYNVYRCWVSEYQALPELDANGNAIAIQTITLENEGWERDYDVSEPQEPSFTLPSG